MAKDSERQTWTGKLEFFLSALGYCIGFRNIWSFPYACYSNGGGAFLYPYMILVFLVGLPFVQLELFLGQFTSQGLISTWKISRLFKGVGYAMTLICALYSIYNIVIITWTIYYMYASLLKTHPWIGCDIYAYVRGYYGRNTELCGRVNNQTIVSITNDTTFTYLRPSDDFFSNRLLGISEGLHQMGSVRLPLLLCLFFAWCIVYLCLIRGINSSGKVAYFTTPFSFVLLFILFIRGVTLPGAAGGILFFIKPDVDALFRLKVWRTAANQVFYSFAAPFGGMLTLASYNKFDKDIQRSGIYIVFSGCCTSLFSGYFAFSIFGFLSHAASVPISNVISEETWQAFITYPEAFSLMPLSRLWSFLFFYMLFIVVLDSEFVMVETVITSVVDELEYHYPGFIKYKGRITFVTCVILFVLGIPFITQGGVYLYVLFDRFSNSFSSMIIGIFECCIICWVYGMDRFAKDVASMTGSAPWIQLQICWKFLTPIVTMLFLILNFMDYSPGEYKNYEFPLWAEVIGWILAMVPVAIIPVVGVIIVYKQRGDSFLERVVLASKPAPDWGPAKDEDRVLAGYAPLDPDFVPAVSATPAQMGYVAVVTDDTTM